ncbi:MAG: membrane protein insertase YidC, partial [Pseudonocardiaceae bacterium]
LMVYLLPLGVVAGGPFFPVAILIYWLSNNLWTLAQQWLVYKRIDVEEAEKRETAIAQRQALAPRPGQKPVRQSQKKATTGTSPAGTSDDTTGSSSDSESGAGSVEPSGEIASNGAGSAGSSSDGSEASTNGQGVERSDGSAPPGMIQQRPRTRKRTNRKRR